MKKHIVALIMVLALLAAVIPMQAMAASDYPLVWIDTTASTPTIQKGGSGQIGVIIEPHYYNERCIVVYVDSDGKVVGENTYSLTNATKEEREITLAIDAEGMELAVGSYKANIYMEYYDSSASRWYQSPQATQVFNFKVILDKCGSSHTLEKTATVIEATCTETGIDEYTCSVCKHVTYQETEIKDHEYELVEFIVVPTQTNAGEALYGCKTCDEEKIEVIPISAVAKITSQPKSVAISAGKVAVFTVKATGSSLKYQWYYRNAGDDEWKKSSCKKATYSVTMSEGLDGRQFYCVVTDEYGFTDESNEVTLTLPVAKITKQPKDTTVGYGEKAVVSIAATGDGIKYQWEYSTDGGENWKKSSCTATSYSQTMTVPVDGRMLRCTVTDTYGNTVTSDEVVLKIERTELKITKQPKDATADSGEKVTVSLTAEGDGLKYQWYYSTDGGETYKISSCTSRSYSQTLSASVDGRMLKCEVSDAYGNSLDSDEVKLSVQRTPLKITKHPQSVSAAYGTKVKLSIAATGDNLKYQWYYKNAGDDEWKKSSCTSTSYSQTLNASVDGRQLRCIVTDGYSDSEPVASDVATLTVERSELKITAQPKSVADYEGQKVTVSVTATGDGLKYQWAYSNDDGASWTDSSCTKRTYSQTLNASVDGRMLKCTVTDAYGNTKTSSAATLDTRFKAKITTQPKNAKVFDGEKAKVSVAATGDGIKYQWYYSTDGGSSFKASSCKSASYSQTMSESIDGRKLYCVVTDKYGNTAKSNTITLSMKKTVEITSQPKSQTKAEGEKATFTVKATGDGLKYQWYYSKDGGSSFSKSSCTKASYSQTANASVDGRQFYCVVTDAYGNTKTTKTVTLNLK